MDDEKLARALRDRDPAAVQQLVDAYGDRLFRAACLLCGNQTEAEDIVQETFLQAVRSAPRFGGRSSLFTWLHGILLNLTRHYHRERQRLVYDEPLADGEPSTAEERPLGSDLDLASSALGNALAELSAAHREIIVLRFYQEMKLHEIAEHLRISKGTVKSRLHYALEELQQRIPQDLNLFSATGTKERL